VFEFCAQEEVARRREGEEGRSRTTQSLPLTYTPAAQTNGVNLSERGISSLIRIFTTYKATKKHTRADQTENVQAKTKNKWGASERERETDEKDQGGEEVMCVVGGLAHVRR